ncbi:membrane protein [Pseudarthrobacter phenanthrenivorans]|uniref:Membrane protein n=2 Tax=Pseudarthrobacter phenanthrenivorans TaxID=361575 RepID=A0A0B4D7B4_PSEPS|nr:membrane protein [Pseudarthrobacter phenanthrenivorans]
MSHPSHPQPPQGGPSAPPVPPAPSSVDGQRSFAGQSGFAGHPAPDGRPGFDPGAASHGPYPDGPRRSFMTTWILSLLLGTFGADRFYLGKMGSAVAKLLTAGGLGIWAIVDLVMTLTGNTRDIFGRPLAGYPENRKKAWIITAVVWLMSIISGIVLTVVSIAMIAAAVDGRNVPVPSGIPSVSQGAPVPSGGSAPDAGSVVATVSEGNTVKVGVLDSIYTAEIPGMSYLQPKNGGFLAVEVSWETQTGTSFSSPSNFAVYDADGKEGELVYLDEGLGALPTEEVGAGDVRQGVIAFDVKKGPVQVVIINDSGDKAAAFTLTAQ